MATHEAVIRKEWLQVQGGGMAADAFIHHLKQASGEVKIALLGEVAEYLVTHKLADKFRLPYPSDMPAMESANMHLNLEAGISHYLHAQKTHADFTQITHSIPHSEDAQNLVKGWVWGSMMVGDFCPEIAPAIHTASEDARMRRTLKNAMPQQNSPAQAGVFAQREVALTC